MIVLWIFAFIGIAFTVGLVIALIWGNVYLRIGGFEYRKENK